MPVREASRTNTAMPGKERGERVGRESPRAKDRRVDEDRARVADALVACEALEVALHGKRDGGHRLRGESAEPQALFLRGFEDQRDVRRTALAHGGPL
jgi:hypothetical protein